MKGNIYSCLLLLAVEIWAFQMLHGEVSVQFFVK